MTTKTCQQCNNLTKYGCLLSLACDEYDHWEPKQFAVNSDVMEPDVVNHPSHYTQGKVECIDAIESATEGLAGFDAYLTGNILKYMWRWSHKNGVEDLKKAKFYLEKLIEAQE